MATDREVIKEAKDRRARVQTYDEDIMSVCTSLMDNLIAIAEKSLDKTCESCKDYLCPACAEKLIRSMKNG